MNADSKVYFEEVSVDWDQMREGFFSERVRETAGNIAQVQRGQSAARYRRGHWIFNRRIAQPRFAYCCSGSVLSYA